MAELLQIEADLQRLRDDADKKLLELARLKKEQADATKNIKAAATAIENKLGEAVNQDAFVQFFKKPYLVLPQGKSRSLIAVPKFVKEFQVGWLWKETDTFYVYQLDQYSAWLSDVPKDLLDEVGLKQEFNATVDGDRIVFEPSERDAVKKALKFHVTDVQDNEARIIRGHAFDVLAEIIEAGCLPFRPRKVAAADLREPKSSIKLRPYQKQAYDKFLETGAVGVFHPTGAGKSFTAMYALDTVKGRKLIVVPTRTLIDQWGYYLETHAPHLKNEVRVVTYQGYRVGPKEYGLVVFDEAQRLPADTFSRLATINTKYRLGLSASPHREDGRESYIFALTGFPVGLNWRDYMATVGRKYHPIHVHVVRGLSAKMAKIRELLDPKKRTFIFCDGLDLGKSIARELQVPFVYGETSDRIDEVKQNRVCVVSRVMDLGVSIKDLSHIIEVDFLMGSRMQELQRTGRLMHSDEANVRHDIVFTDKELDSYGKRLWALQEKGFTIKMHGGD